MRYYKGDIVEVLNDDPKKWFFRSGDRYRINRVMGTTLRVDVSDSGHQSSILSNNVLLSNRPLRNWIKWLINYQE